MVVVEFTTTRPYAEGSPKSKTNAQAKRSMKETSWAILAGSSGFPQLPTAGEAT